MWNRVLLMAGAFSVIAGQAIAASSGAGTGSICGTVHDTDKPLVYANVVVLGTKLGRITSETGSFSMDGVPSGIHEVQCSYIGYHSSTKMVAVRRDIATAINFALEVEPLGPDCVIVETRCGMIRGGCGMIQGGCFGGALPLKNSAAALKEPVAAKQEPSVPRRFALAQNHPNPCNPATEIGFELGGRTPSRLRIYDVAGRLVRVLLDETLDAGPHAVVWDGRNDQGKPVSSGIYFYRFEAADFAATRRLVVLK